MQKTAFTVLNSDEIWFELLDRKHEDRAIKRITDVSKCEAEDCEEQDALMLCTGCRAAKYCSAECQKDHWDTHKDQCVPFELLPCVLREDLEGCEILLSESAILCDKLAIQLIARAVDESGPQSEFHIYTDTKRMMHVGHYTMYKRKKVPEETLKELKLCAPDVWQAVERIRALKDNQEPSSQDTALIWNAIETNCKLTHQMIEYGTVWQHPKTKDPEEDGDSETKTETKAEPEEPQQPKKYRPIFHYVLATGNKKLVELFLGRGCNPDQQDTEGYTGVQAIKAHEFTRKVKHDLT